MIDQQLAARIRAAGVIAVITIDDASRAASLAQSLLEGGVTAIELTLRTPGALAAMEAIASGAPAMMIGAGTVLNVEQLAAVRDAGATFAVAPGFNPEMVTAADAMRFPFSPGVMTPSEIECAFALGCSVLKFYHAGVAGGLSALKSMAAPYAHLGLRFIPLGGVSPDNLGAWLRDEMILAVGGSWIAPRGDIADGNFGAISERATAAISVLKQERGR